MLRSNQPNVTFRHIITLDLDLDPTLELPLVWITISMLSSIWTQRKKRRVSVARTRAELEAGCRLLREGKVKSLLNAHTLTDISLKAILNII